ncbi:MAG: hypothetical protein KAU90_04395 [Sulfurovaceae bacterium]|nr:hypothetical protein [Sulfurovaceae bacterium]
MKKYFISTLLISSTIFASTNPITFDKTYGGKEHDIAKSVVKLDDGYLIAGESRSFHEDRDFNAYIIKIDKYGEKIWSKIYGGKDDEHINGLTKFGKDFVFVGSTKSFDMRNKSFYFANIDQNGKVNWEKTYYRYDDDYYYGNDIIADGKKLVIAGVEKHLEFFNAKINPMLFKINSDGDMIWHGYYGGKDEDRANAVINTKNGYIFAGKSETYGHGDFDAFVVGVNKKGKREWFHAYGGKDDEVAHDIIETKDGYILVGSTDSFGLNYKDVYVVKIDKRGKTIWQHSYGGKYDDIGYAITKSPDGGFVIVGKTETRRNGDDLYLLKIDANGKIKWNRTYGGESDDVGYDIVTTDDGYLIVGDKKTDRSRDSNVWVLKTDFKGKVKR